MTNPLADPYIVLSRVYTDGQYLKQALAQTPIEAANKTRTVKICYGVLDNDIYLDYIIAANVRENPKRAVRLILKIALYMLEFMQKHDYMVVDSAVELAKKAGKGGTAGFINAFLRGYTVPPLPQNPTLALSVKYSASLWLVKKLKRSYKAEAEQILAAKSAGSCVRFVRGEENYLSIPHIKTPFDGVYVYPNFTRDENFFSGGYTFQSVGSVAICNAVKGCARIMDACAAPGGKSAYLAEKCGYVLSCEIYPHRAQLIREYFSRMGVKNAEVRVCDSSIYLPEYEGAFDAVLCDAPCSGTGVIAENPDIKLNRKEEDIPALCAVQSAILNNCARYVKAGGTLYYSTCSILPEENDSAAVKFLADNPDFSLEIPQSPLPHKKTGYGLQFLPHISIGAGFYLTSFVKKS